MTRQTPTPSLPVDIAARLHELGRQLVRPGAAPLPWVIREVARGAAVAHDLDYETALSLVGAGVEEAES